MIEVLWNHLFVLTLPVAEKLLRPVLIYGFLVLGLRFAGKRELAQLNPFDLVVLLTLSNTVQNGIIGDDETVTGAVLGASALLGINHLVARWQFKHVALERLVEGEPRLLVDGGKLLHDDLRRELITLADLESAARRQGYASLDEVERALLEPGGAISFIGKKPDPTMVQFSELNRRLDGVASMIAELRSAVAPHRPA